jgi:hypothetical protein
MDQPDMGSNNSATDSGQGSVSSANPPDVGNVNITDRARDIAGTTRERLADVGGTLRERAGTMKDSLADAIESGADKLRGRASAAGGGAPLAGATGATGVAVVSDGRVAQVSDKVAGGMQATADWLREADLDSLKSGIERQVKEHPGRTLLIAVGLGYLLGKALRK